MGACELTLWLGPNSLFACLCLLTLCLFAYSVFACLCLLSPSLCGRERVLSWTLHDAQQREQDLVKGKRKAVSGGTMALQDLVHSSLQGDELRAEIHKVAAQNHSPLDYRQVWDALEAVDGGRDIYTNAQWPIGKQAGMRCGGGKASGKLNMCFNREHAWPQSWWGGHHVGGAAATDLYALYLVDQYANEQRGNLPLGVVRKQEAVFSTPAGARKGPCALEAAGGTHGAQPRDTTTPPPSAPPPPTGNPGSGMLHTGHVKFFNPKKQFGFVVLGDGREVFVHASSLVGSSGPLASGDLVRMKVTKNSRGWAGKQVERVPADATAAPQSHCFEPPDEVKGDLARAYFYMSVRYMHQFQCCQNNAVAGARIQAPLEAVLRRWHHQDPVDAREQERARCIAHDWQGNVNPFILFPQLVDHIEDF